MKKLMGFINVRDLVTSVVSSTIILSLIACGGGAGLQNMIPSLPGLSTVKHLVHLPTSGSVVSGRNSKPLLAAMFQASGPTPSQLPQSFDVQCTIFQGLSVPAGGLIVIPAPNQGVNNCNEFVTDPQPQIEPGKLTITDGTLSSLVVTGRTSSATFQCRDLTNTMAITDNSQTQAYLDPTAHKVVIVNQPVNGTSTTAPFVCNGIGSDTDPVVSIEVMWVKE